MNGKYKRLAVYSIDQPTTVNANSSVSKTLTIGQLDFFCKGLVGKSAGTQGQILMQIRDNQSQRDWFDKPVTIESVIQASMSAQNGMFGEQKVQAQGNIVITLSNTSGGNLAVYLSLCGYEEV